MQLQFDYTLISNRKFFELLENQAKFYICVIANMIGQFKFPE